MYILKNFITMLKYLQERKVRELNDCIQKQEDRIAKFEEDLANIDILTKELETLKETLPDIEGLKKQVEELKEENAKLDRSRDYYKKKYESLKDETEDESESNK